MNRALIIGISDYPAPVSKLPAVAADVREIGKLLASPKGTFRGQVVDVLTDAQATRPRVLNALEAVFRSAGPGDTVFVYMAGHGAIAADGGGAYYFVTHDVAPGNLAATAVPLVTVKRLFDECRSRQVLLWLDFCHSGGIIPRRLGRPAEDDNQVIARELKVVQGDGKLIFAACTPEQYAWEDAALGHGLFTASLLSGLRGDAASAGEVTASSLYDYIDRQMGSGRQRPMMFGHQAGRLVLMHYDADPKAKKSQATGQGAAPQKPASPKPGRTKGVAAGSGSGRAVDSSGDWCLLGDAFFRTKAVRRDRGGAIAVDIPSGTADTDAALGRLRPVRFGGARSVGFAHLNDALLVRVEHVESVSTGGQQVWTVALRPEDAHYGGGLMEMGYGAGQRHYSADDLARLRAGRILLNDPPPRPPVRHGLDPDATLEGLIQGLGTAMPAKACVIQTVYKEYGRSREFLKLARLACILQLKASGVVEEVLGLALGPVRQESVHVRFRGRRARAASNVEPPVIEVEGDCPLI